MLGKFQKYMSLLLALVLIVLVLGYYAMEKSGLSADEVHTYSLANGSYSPNISSLRDGDLVDTLLTREELLEYVTAGESGFDPGSVYYSAAEDTAAPLYLFFLNGVSSATNATFGKWAGVALNAVIYLLVCFMLYGLCRKFFRCHKTAVTVTLLFGVSTLGISSVISVSGYAMLAFFSVALLYLFVGLLESSKLYTPILIGITAFFGVLSGFSFAVIALFATALFAVRLLRMNEKGRALQLAVPVIIGVGAAMLVFPAAFGLFTDGFTVADTFIGYPVRFADTLITVGVGMAAMVAVSVIVLIVTTILSGKGLIKNKECTFKVCGASLILWTAILSAVVLMGVSADYSDGFVYGITPLLALVMGYPIHDVCCAETESTGIKVVLRCVLIAAFAAAVVCAAVITPDHLCREQGEQERLAAEYSDAPCVYFTKKDGDSVTDDIRELVHFKDVLFTDSASSAVLDAYVTINDSAELTVVYVQPEILKSDDEAINIIEKLVLKNGYYSFEPVYSDSNSQMYVAKK